MAGLTERDLQLIKKALAIAVLAIERQPGRFPSTVTLLSTWGTSTTFTAIIPT